VLDRRAATKWSNAAPPHPRDERAATAKAARALGPLDAAAADLEELARAEAKAAKATAARASKPATGAKKATTAPPKDAPAAPAAPVHAKDAVPVYPPLARSELAAADAVMAGVVESVLRAAPNGFLRGRELRKLVTAHAVCGYSTGLRLMRLKSVPTHPVHRAVRERLCAYENQWDAKPRFVNGIPGLVAWIDKHCRAFARVTDGDGGWRKFTGTQFTSLRVHLIQPCTFVYTTDDAFASSVAPHLQDLLAAPDGDGTRAEAISARTRTPSVLRRRATAPLAAPRAADLVGTGRVAHRTTRTHGQFASEAGAAALGDAELQALLLSGALDTAAPRAPSASVAPAGAAAPALPTDVFGAQRFGASSVRASGAAPAVGGDGTAAAEKGANEEEEVTADDGTDEDDEDDEDAFDMLSSSDDDEDEDELLDEGAEALARHDTTIAELEAKLAQIQAARAAGGG
jgi:hypothetical protein